MGKIAPESPRARVREEWGGELTIDMPSRKQAYLLWLYPVWTAVWGVGMFFVSSLLRDGRGIDRPFPGFVPLWLVCWAVAGVFVLSSWLWALFGREVVHVEGNWLTLSRKVFGVGPSWSMDRRVVRHVRAAAAVERTWAGLLAGHYSGRDPYSLQEATIAFDYEGRTWRIGAGIEETEAAGLIELLRRHVGANTEKDR